MGSFSLAKLKGRDIFLLTLVGLLLFGLLWFYGAYSSSKAQIDAKKTELDSLETQVQASRAAVAQLPGLREEVAKLEVQRDELLSALPATQKIGTVLGEIRRNVLASGAQLTGVTQTAGATGTLPPGVRTIGINLNVNGQFGQLYGVLRSLEGMSRFSTINSLGLTLGQATSFDPDLTGQVGVTIYTFDPNAAGATPAAPGASQNGTPAAPAAPSAPPAGGNS